MPRIRHFLIVLLILGVITGSLATTLLLARFSDHTNAANMPINANWSPVYVDDEVESALSKTDLMTEVAPAVVSITTQGVSYDMFYRAVPETV